MVSVSVLFHVAAASLQTDPGTHASSLRTSSFKTRQTAISPLQPLAQKSAVTRRCRSGDRRGSAGNSNLRLVVRCNSVNSVAWFVVV